jgi:hypothetical protein
MIIMQSLVKYLIIGMIFTGTLTVAGCQESASGIQIEEAWGRASPESAANGAFYMKIKNSSQQGDTLLSVSSTACGVVEIHNTVMENDTMSMHPMAEGLHIPAGETIELKTGGMHLMCIDKQADFTPGAKLPLILQFDQAGEIDLEIEVRNP